jgi:anthranilate synthase component 1
MMFYPGLEEVRKLSKKYNVIPVSMEVYADMETPISLFQEI